MEKMIFYIVDVFTEAKYEGNQLAVLRNVKELSDRDMQRIAKEMNYSETTFILSEVEKDGGYDVRIFTPKEEVPFAGHPTLGTAFVIQSEIIRNQVDTINLNLKVGQIPVTIVYSRGVADILWMKQNPPDFGSVFDTQTVSDVLGIDEVDIDKRFPVQEVSTGLPFIIVPLKSLQALKRARLEKDKYLDLVKDAEAKAFLLFCSETYHSQNQLNVRVFADYYGVPEDPATGSANGCLNSYLVKHRFFGKDRIDIRVEQGYEIGRPSLLFLRGEERKGVIEVYVGGKVILVARGEIV
jgi:trans-2,3-dihydro-3-hydroxyanthranilate isomerase